MPIRKGHVAPQNTFVNYIIRKFETLGRKFIIANARTANCAIIYANDGFCNLTGFSRSDIMQKSCWCEFLYGRRTAPSAVAEMKTCMQTKLEVNCEITLYRQNKSHFLCQVLIVPVKNEQEEVVMLVLAFEEMGPDNQTPLDSQPPFNRKFSVFQTRTSRLLSLPMTNLSQLQSKFPNVRSKSSSGWSGKRSLSVVQPPTITKTSIGDSHQRLPIGKTCPSIIAETSISITNADSDHNRDEEDNNEGDSQEEGDTSNVMIPVDFKPTPHLGKKKWSNDTDGSRDDDRRSSQPRSSLDMPVGIKVSSQHATEDSENNNPSGSSPSSNLAPTTSPSPSPLSGPSSNFLHPEYEPMHHTPPYKAEVNRRGSEGANKKQNSNLLTDGVGNDVTNESNGEDESFPNSPGRGGDKEKRRKSFTNLLPQTLALPKSDFLTRAVSQLSVSKHSRAPSLSDVSNYTVTENYDEDLLRNFRHSVKNKFAQVLSLGLDVLPEYKVQPQRIHPWTVLHYSPFKAAWDWLILILVIYTAISTPYVAAFVLPNKQGQLDTSIHRYSDPITLIDMLVDILFIIDIIINFRTTYVNSQEEVISTPSKIAAHYFKGWFLIDLVAAVPFDLLLFGSEEDETTTLIALLKTARLLRLVRVARKLDRYSEYGPAVLILLMCSFSLIAHWLACIWYAIANMERPTLEYKIGWIDQLGDQINQPFNDSQFTIPSDASSLYAQSSPLVQSQLNNNLPPRALPGEPGGGPSMKATYITALYFTFSSLTSVGFGNISPNTNAEKIFSILVMLIGSLMYASIFGNVSAIIQRLYSGTSRYHNQLMRIREFIKFHQIKNPLKNKLEEYFQHEWNYRNGIDMRSVLLTFPECLQADIRLHLNNVLLSRSNVFTDASLGCKRALALKFETTYIPPGDSLIFQGDRLDNLYFIGRGSIEILGDNDEVVAILSPEDVFGDAEAFGSPNCAVGKSRYVVRALTYCDLHRIKHEDLLSVLDWYPEFMASFYEKLQVTFSLRDPNADISPKQFYADMIPLSQLSQFDRIQPALFNPRGLFINNSHPHHLTPLHPTVNELNSFSASDSRVNTVGQQKEKSSSQEGPKFASSDVNLQRSYPPPEVGGGAAAMFMSKENSISSEQMDLHQTTAVLAGDAFGVPTSGLARRASSNLTRSEVKLLHTRMAKLETRMDEMESNISTQLAFITKSLLQITTTTTSHINNVYHHLNNPPSIHNNNNNTSSSSRPLQQSIYNYNNANLPHMDQQGVTPVLFANSETTGSKMLQETKLTEPTILPDSPEKVNKTQSSHC